MMASTEESLALVEGLARIVRDYRLDALAFGDVKLARSYHEPLPEPRKPGAPKDADDEEELLFHSAGA